MEGGALALVPPAINLGVLLAFLFVKLKDPVRASVAARSVNVRDEVARVEGQLKTAQDRHAEFTAKLKAIEAEVAAIREEARQDGAAARTRIQNEAKRLGAQIVADAQSNSQALFGDLRNLLRRELGEQVLDRAERLIRERLTHDDRVRIRRAFSQQVEKMQ